MYESVRRREKPGRGCLIGFAIVVGIILCAVLFLRFGLPRIIGKMIAEGKTNFIIPEEVSEQLKEHKAEFQEALKQYNMDAKQLGKTIDSLSSKKVLQFSDDILTGKLADADQAVEELIDRLDFGNADVEQIKKDLKETASYREFQNIAREIEKQKDAVKFGLPFIRDTIKSFLSELQKDEQ